MRKQTFLFAILLLFSGHRLFAELKVSNQPTGAAVVITQPSAVFVTWSIQSTETAPVSVVSEEGLFLLGDQVLGRVGTLLNTTVAPNGTGFVTETLLIPPDIAGNAVRQKAPTFFYERTFRSTGSGSSGRSRLTCRLSTSAYGNFSIAAVTLFFQNQRGEITWDQNNRTARATAEVRYNGTGLLKAAWEVQEPGSSQFRVIQQVQYHLAFGDRIVFETPQVPALPTVVTGRHLVRFRIDQPVSGFELPTIAYVVKTAPPGNPKEKGIELRSPASGSQIVSSPEFEWLSEAQGIALLKFSIHEKKSVDSILGSSSSVEPLSDSNELSGSGILQSNNFFLAKGVLVFSAELPPNTQKYVPRNDQLQRLHPQKWYVWQVVALDENGKIISESELRSFQTGKQDPT
jgi:hypothetical protein